MLGVITGYGVIASIIVIGYVAARTGVLGLNAREVTARVVFFVGTPALLFATLSDADVGAVWSVSLLVVGISTVLVGVAFTVVAVTRWRWDPADTTIGALAACYANAGNIGIPVAIYVLEDISLVAPLLLFQQILITPLALTVLDQSSAQLRRTRSRMVVQPLLNPILLATVGGLIVAAFGIPIPGPVMEPVDLVAGIAVPLALMSFGMSLHNAPTPGLHMVDKPLALALSLKTLLQPVIAFLIGRLLFGLDDTALFAVTVIAALPTAQHVYVFAVRYGRLLDFARDAVLISTIASAAVLVVLAALLAG
ncbi:MAG TPA: AEC family transporter [Jiangellaceae bacterium]